MGKPKALKVKTNKIKILNKDTTIKKTSKKVKEESIKKVLKNKVKKPESKLNVDLEQVKLAIEGLFKLSDEQPKKLLEEEYPILLQVTAVKIPNCPSRIIRLPLKHNLLTDTSEVCLIVSDLKRGRRVDYNPTVEHYEEILRKNKIENIKRIIPMNCIRTEYDQFELKRRLVMQYDQFLVDGKITGHIYHLLGRLFYEKKKSPNSVRFDRSDLKGNIESALKKTQIHIHSKGNTYLTQIGHSKMNIDEILENFESVCVTLKKEMPGKWENIRALHVKTPHSMAIPVYMTLKSSNAVSTPYVKRKKPKMSEDVVGELSTKSDETEVRMTADGTVTLIKKTEKSKNV